MYRIKYSFLMFILLFTLNHNSFAGTHTISTTVELTATAINRYLNTQYNNADFPRSFAAGSYIVSLILPEILLTPNNAALHMVFDVYSGTVKLYRFEIKPSISIPAGSITGSQILAFCTDLTAKLDAVMPILPAAIKQGIIEKYNLLGFLLYPSKLIDQVNTTWFASQSIYLADPYFSLTWQVTNDAINLTVSAYLNAQERFVNARLTKDSNSNCFIGFMSNFQVTIKDVYITDGQTTLEFHPNALSPKITSNVTPLEINLGNIGLVKGVNEYPCKVVFINDNTWYTAEYSLAARDPGTQYFSTNELENFH